MSSIYIVNLFNPNLLSIFFTYGIVANIIFGLIVKCIVFSKYTSFNEDEKRIYFTFFNNRNEYAKKNNSTLKLVLNLFSFLIPTYTAWLYTIFIWNYSRDASVYGICKGVMWFDKFSFFQIAKYKNLDK